MKYLPLLILLVGCAPEGKFGKKDTEVLAPSVNTNRELDSSDAKIRSLETIIAGLEKDLSERKDYFDIKKELESQKERLATQKEGAERSQESCGVFRSLLVSTGRFETEAEVWDLYLKAINQVVKEEAYERERSESDPDLGQE